jgi:hypothetical protein
MTWSAPLLVLACGSFYYKGYHTFVTRHSLSFAALYLFYLVYHAWDGGSNNAGSSKVLFQFSFFCRASVFLALNLCSHVMNLAQTMNSKNMQPSAYLKIDLKEVGTKLDNSNESKDENFDEVNVDDILLSLQNEPDVSTNAGNQTHSVKVVHIHNNTKTAESSPVNEDVFGNSKWNSDTIKQFERLLHIQKEKATVKANKTMKLNTVLLQSFGFFFLVIFSYTSYSAYAWQGIIISINVLFCDMLYWTYVQTFIHHPSYISQIISLACMRILLIIMDSWYLGLCCIYISSALYLLYTSAKHRWSGNLLI